MLTLENFKKYCKEKSINFFLLVSIILSIVPLIVRVKKVTLDSYSAAILGNDVTYDLFSQYKAYALMFFSMILIGCMIIFRKMIFEKKDKIINIILILSGIFLVFCLISTILSPYKNVSLFGVYNRGEGFLSILCYFILFTYSIFTFKKTENYRFLTTPILIIVFINAFLGIFQFAGQDLIKTELGKMIVVPQKIIEETGGGNLSLLYEKGKLYGTLFHYNYVGSFACIVIPILFAAMIYEYDIMYKLILGMGFLSSVWLLFGSTSRGGLIGVFAIIIVSIIIFGRAITKNKKGLLIGIVSSICFIVFLNIVSSGSIFQRIPSLFKDTVSVFSNSSNIDYKSITPIKDIKNINGTVDLVFQNKTLNLRFEDNKYQFSCNGSKVTIDKGTGNNCYYFNTTDLPNVFFKLYKSSNEVDRLDLLELVFNNNNSGHETFYFKVKSDNTIHLVNPKTFQDIDLKEAESVGFKGKEKLGSSRGYIWSRSIPLLKNCLFVGKGPDTFMLYFPQNDLIGKYYAFENPNILVDKPHNLYLGIALNNGLIALCAFILIMFIYIVDSFRLYALKKKYVFPEIFGISIFLGVIGYLAAGMFNDSIISVAPIFWIVLGVGIAINYINRKGI